MSSAIPRPPSAHDALRILTEGNARFVSNVRSIEALGSHARRGALTEGQSPLAIVLSCSDSRVPSELVFDCGLGDLFVVRVAGNVCAPSLVGSVEFAASTFGTQLVVVMGHTSCGAIKATIDVVSRPDSARVPSENIGDIVGRIRPAVMPLLKQQLSPAALVREATRANIRQSADQLRVGSRILEERIADGRLLVVAAEYSLDTGHVDFFDAPAARSLGDVG